MVIANSVYLVLSELGLAAFGEDEAPISSIKFNDPISAFRLIRRSEAPEELLVFINRLDGFRILLVNDLAIKSILERRGLRSDMMTDDQISKYQTNRPEMLVKANLASSHHDAITKLREFAILLSSNTVKETSERLDLHLIQSINALDEFDKIINVVGSRLREWYGLHFPELDNLVQSLNAYALIVREAGQREDITRQILESAGMQEKKIDIILDARKRSKGGDLAQNNLDIIKKLADEVIVQSDLRNVLADHVEAIMTALAPNTKELLTATVGARMIAKAGSFAKFAHLPASTVQILGAEKALFRSLKTGARPPKHGLLFQHPLIHSAPRWQRGKIARTVASKVSIVARIDLYRHGERDYSILEKMNSRIAEIREKYKNPPSNENEFVKYQDISRRPFRDRRTGVPSGRIGRNDSRSKKRDRRPHGRKRKKF
jgi:nucleolar protein 56